MAHNSVDVAAEIQVARAVGAELILLCGCSAIADRQDILPMAIEDAGGQIDQLGPVSYTHLTLPTIWQV